MINQIMLIILMLLVGFIAGIAVSCCTVILKIEKATGTHNIHDALDKVNQLNKDIGKATKEANLYSIKIARLTKKVNSTRKNILNNHTHAKKNKNYQPKHVASYTNHKHNKK